MIAPEHFEIVGARGFFRPVGVVSLDVAVDMVTAAIVFARAEDIRELLVNAVALTGFPSPDTVQRFFFVEKWALAAGGALRIAMVSRAELIDPEKFGVTVAANRGLVSDVFLTEDAAVIWLDNFRNPSGT